MEKIKLIAFDIDGTILPRGAKDIEDSTKLAIKEFEDRGGKIMIATGRCPYFIPECILHSVKTDYYVTVNGALLTDGNFNTIHKTTIREEYFHKLLDTGLKLNIAMGYKFEKAIAVYNRFEDYVRVYTGKLYPKLELNYERERNYHLDHGMPLGCFAISDDEDLERFANATPEVEWVHAYKGAMECYSKKASKASGIRYVAERLGIAMEEVMVFGDSENDIDMIKKAGIGVAMGNAGDNVKAVADYITTDCGDNGVYNALKHFAVI